MENYLELDLNELASKAIKEKIESIEQSNEDLQLKIKELRIVNYDLQKKINLSENIIFMSGIIKDKYASITKTKKTSDCYEKSIAENRYKYISDLMNLLFGIKEKYGFKDGGLWRNLAINYYENKQELVSILKIIETDDSLFCGGIISDILSFKMPIDFTKDQILKYVKNPHYCTNGCVYGVSQFYMQSDGNTPHDLYQINKHILEDDVFNEVLNTIKSNKSNYHYLYTIPIYIALPVDKIQQMGELLINEKHLDCDEVKKFISNNICLFNQKTLDYLFTKVSDENEYKLFYWQKFPVKYQQQYLMSKDIGSIIKIISHYSCKWTVEEKDKFLSDYYLTKTK